MSVRSVVWNLCADRMPKERDADAWGCVLVWHKYQGVMVTGWHRVQENEFYVAWARTPMGPEGV